jgi:hypothetical protein
MGLPGKGRSRVSQPSCPQRNGQGGCTAAVPGTRKVNNRQEQSVLQRPLCNGRGSLAAGSSVAADALRALNLAYLYNRKAFFTKHFILRGYQSIYHRIIMN